MIKKIAAYLCFTAFTVAAGASDERHYSCDTLKVFSAKKIYTMNPGQPTASAVAACDGKIVSVVSNEKDLEPWKKRSRQTINKDMSDKIILPGFIDSHQHALLGAITANLPSIATKPLPQPYGPDIKGVTSPRQALARLAAFHRDMEKPDEPLLAWGWDVPSMGRHMNRQELDRISASRPIFVWDASEHHVYANSAAITLRGIDEKTDLHGMVKDTDGKLTGQFLGPAAAARMLTPFMAEKLQPENAMRLMRWLVDLNRRNGITTTTEHAMGLFSLEAETQLLAAFFNDRKTPQRLLAITRASALINQSGGLKEAQEQYQRIEQLSTDKVFFHGLKFFTDDSFNGLTFKPGAAGYVDGHQGQWMTHPKDLRAKLEPWWNQGEQLFVHAIGDEAHDAVIKTLRELQDNKPRFDHRFTFEHFGTARLDQIRAMHQLGAQANVNVYYLWLRGQQYSEVIGKDRADTLAPLGNLVREGVPVTFHSDFPVAPPRPLLGASLAASRSVGSGQVLGEHQRVSVTEALRMITIDAAYVLGLDDKIGSLEPGKLADMTVLEDDPYDTDPEDIRNISVWGTVVGARTFPLKQSD